MCFSPEASFTASAVVTTVGIISYKKANDLPSKIFSLIPLFFGAQQFFEGMVWLSLQYDGFSAANRLSSLGFIFFAWVVWPFFVPYAHFQMEENPLRKNVLKALTFIGGGLSLFLAYAMLSRNIESKILDCSIIYDFDVQHSLNQAAGLLYLAVAILPTLVSSTRFAWLLGVMNLVAYFVTKVFISDRILSVWCFFAAISSIIVLLIVIERKKQSQLSSLV